VKGSLQTSRDGRRRDRKVVADLDALRALANPHRAAILKLLMAGRPRTATECADHVEATPSACSYHLRQLERFGFVERADEDDDAASDSDGRMRRWRASAVGFSLGTQPLSQANPESLAVYSAIWQADRVENDRLATQFAEHFDEFPPEWQDVADFRTYELDLAVDEMARALTEIDAILLPFRAGARHAGSGTATRAVHITLQAFPRQGDTQ